MSGYLTAALPGIGGSIRREPEDFFVEEIPLYEPCGEGEHLYLTVEKRGLSTHDLLRELARALNLRERDLGYAGLKDARAVTRQTISLPCCPPEKLERLNIPGVKVLSAVPHHNKLRPGHLAGNRFRIRIHRPTGQATERAAAVLEVLAARGVPNRFGEQRYGALGNSHRIGRALLRGTFEQAIEEIIGSPDAITHPRWQEAARAFRSGDITGALRQLPRHCRPERQLLEQLKAGKPAREAVLAMPRKLLRLYLSAYQSSLFDRLVASRLHELDRLRTGDLAYKHANGVCFEVVAPVTEQPRADSFEISPSAPLFGYKVRLAKGDSGNAEQELLNGEGLTLEAFRLSAGLSMEGERRPLRVPLHGASCALEQDDLVVNFTLPRGSFATTVLAEIMKTGTDA